jgi:hypothetical protein
MFIAGFKFAAGVLAFVVFAPVALLFLCALIFHAGKAICKIFTMDIPGQLKATEIPEQQKPTAEALAEELENNFEVFWSTLTNEERADFEKQAFDEASSIDQRVYLDIKQNGRTFEEYGGWIRLIQRRTLLDYFKATRRIEG